MKPEETAVQYIIADLELLEDKWDRVEEETREELVRTWVRFAVETMHPELVSERDRLREALAEANAHRRFRNRARQA